MEQKRFKSLRNSAIIKQYDAGDIQIQVQQRVDHFDIYVDGVKVETFKTKDAALKVAEQAAKGIGNK
jgi:hypothetical protein